MHYANGREAHNGDKVVFKSGDSIQVGFLYDAVPGNDACNGRLALITNTDPWTNLQECLHIDDFNSAFGDHASVPDTSAPTPVLPDPLDPPTVTDDAQCVAVDPSVPENEVHQ